MINQYIFVKKQEHLDYLTKAYRKNNILLFWLSIYRTMPKSLRNEAKLKPTCLVQRNKSKFEIMRAITFQFETRDASEDLLKYLNDFAVFVESDYSEALEYKDKLH